MTNEQVFDINDELSVSENIEAFVTTLKASEENLTGALAAHLSAIASAGPTEAAAIWAALQRAATQEGDNDQGLEGNAK